MLRYLVYCRKSTDDKEKQVLSIESQVEEIKQFASREKLNIVDWVIESKTAKTPGRPKFNQVLDRVEKGEFDGIISWHPDRLARNSVDGGRIIYLLDTGSLKDLKFPTFWFDSTPQGKFMLNIAFGQSKYYVDNLSINVARGMRQKIRRGDWPGKAPYGYRNNRQNKSIEVDTKTSKIVKTAFQLFSTGHHSFTAISKFMAGEGMTRGNGKPLSINQIKSMFKKKFYIGILEYKGSLYDGNHHCFISKKLFNQVQAVLKTRNRSHDPAHHFAFTGLIKCGQCGASITSESHQKYYKGTDRVAQYVYYRCTKKIIPCDQPYVSEDFLTKQFNQTIKKYAINPQWKPTIDNWLTQKKAKESLKVKAKLKTLTRELQDTQTKLTRLLDLFLDSGLDDKTYRLKQNQLFEHKKKLEDKIQKIRNNGSHWLEPFNEFTNCAILAHKIAHKKSDRDQLRQVAENIGSNFKLKDKKLFINAKTAYLLLVAGGGATTFDPCPDALYKFVTPRRIELRFVG